MEIRKYNVLWIDDKHLEEKGVRRRAIDYDINLVPFKSMNGGCEALEKNIHFFDAILLDAKFFENEDDPSGSEHTKWIHRTKERILGLEKTFEYFVLTGQAATYASEEFNNAFQHVFEKGEKESQDKCFEILVEAAKRQPYNHLRNKYPNPFALCTADYIGVKHFDRILKIIQDVENPWDIVNAQDLLNPLRKIIEGIFKKLNEIGCIPDEISQSAGSINGSSYFLAGRRQDYIYKEEIIHPLIAENIHRLLNITQDASHDAGHKLSADDYLSNSKNNHLYLSNVYLLLDIMDWMKAFIDGNSDKAINLAKWEAKNNVSDEGSEVDWIKGTVNRIAENGWGTFLDSLGDLRISIPPTMVELNELEVNDSVEIITRPSPDNTKFFIKEIKKTKS